MTRLPDRAYVRWTELVLENGWAAGLSQPPGVARTADGFVVFRGVLAGAAAALYTVAFTLPVHLRPQVATHVPCVSWDGASTSYATLLVVDPDGTVVPHYGSEEYIALNGVQFHLAIY